MALLKELKGSFVGGQVSPELQNRTDLEKFNTFLKEAKNTKIKPEGGISNRAGTVFIGIAKESTLRLTINVNVTATIIINGVEYAGVTTKSVDLPVGSAYTYSVGASGYVGQSGSGTITQNTTETITLEASVETYTFTITNSQGATIKINGTEQSTITDNSGTTITWSVELEGYVTQSGTFILTEDKTLDITLEEIIDGTVTIVATPSYATIRINGVEQNTITGAIGSTFTYEVSATGYVTDSGTMTITQVSETKTINLQETFIEIGGINTNQTNHYIAHLKIQDVLTKTINKTGTYRITLKGGCGYSMHDVDYGEVLNKFGKGGTIVTEKEFTAGQVLTVKKISGASVAYYLNIDVLLCGGAGVALFVDNVVKLVAGGGASYRTYSYQDGDKYNSYGGGGYVGGHGEEYNQPTSYDPETFKGYSVDGTRGNSYVTNTGACGESSKANGRGGTGYVASGYTATTQYSANNGNGYFKLEFIQ